MVAGGPTDGQPNAPRTGSEAPGTPPVLDRRKPTPLHLLARGVLSLLLLYVIFGVLIPSFADYDDVWAAITSLTVIELLEMLGITLVIDGAKSAAPATLLPGLGLGRAFLAQESAEVVSNTIPGPSGTVSKYATYTRYGIDPVDSGKAMAVNGALSNAIPLMLPSVAIALLATQSDIPDQVLILALVGLAISVLGVVLAVRLMQSESFARRFGELLGRLVNWARGLLNRPPTRAVGEAVAGLRRDVLETVRAHWLALTAIILLKEFATYLALLISLRSVGAERLDLTAIEVFAVYSVVRLLTLVKITPGNVGVAEALYITALTWASQTTSEDTIVAGVFVFRMFTYLVPIIIGGGCWLVLRHYFRRHPRPSGPAARRAFGLTSPPRAR